MKLSELKPNQMNQIEISEINLAEYNPRKITQEELNGLVQSIRKFGFVEPIVINKRTGNLVGGHQRVKAAQMIGMTTVPYVDVDLSEPEEKALNIALNSHTLSGKFDLEVLSTILEDLKIDLPDLCLDLRFNVLEKDLGIQFNVDTDFSEAEQEKKKLQFITCPYCNEVFEKAQAKSHG